MPEIREHMGAHRNLIAGCLLFLILGVGGVVLYPDYGISWDEPVQRAYGELVYNYVTEGDQSLLADRHRVYGPVVETLLYSLEKGLGLDEPREVYLMRHLMTFMMFALGAVFFYLLSARILGSYKMGLLGAALLIFSPRIFAHAFYNSKDIPFMAMFIVCVYTLLRHLDGRSLRTSILHGACCAVLVDIRIVGVFVPLLTLALFIYDMSRRKPEGRSAGRIALKFGAFCAALVPLTILLWPTLWSDPVGNFVFALDAMRKFTWQATVLFMGEEVWSTGLPAHYTTVWILITTPLMYTALAVTGVIASLLRLARKGGAGAVAGRDMLLALLWLFAPLAFLIASGAVLYDTWRHTFFVYPAHLLLALIGLDWIIGEVRRGKRTGPYRICAAAVAVLLAVNMVAAAAFMIRSHPHQNVYFNTLVGGVKGAAGRYEMDYWGLSYRELLESLLEADARHTIRLHTMNEPGYYNSLILPVTERERLVYVESREEADYYITNFRWDRTAFPGGSEFRSVKVHDVMLSAAYRIR